MIYPYFKLNSPCELNELVSNKIINKKVYTIFIGFNFENLGGLAVAIPGALKGYSTIYNLYGGGVRWETLFDPTIKLCEEGITVSGHLESSLKFDEDLIHNDTMLRYYIMTILLTLYYFINKQLGR